MSTSRTPKFKDLPRSRNESPAANPSRERRIANFIDGAESRTQAPIDDRWAYFDDGRLFPGFSLRFTEREKEKLKFAAGAMGVSNHEFCRQVIFAKVAEVLDKIEKNEDPRSVEPFPHLRK